MKLNASDRSVLQAIRDKRLLVRDNGVAPFAPRVVWQRMDRLVRRGLLRAARADEPCAYALTERGQCLVQTDGGSP